MVAKSLRTGLAVVLLLSGARSACAAVSSAEDLGACRLLNGRVTLPAAGSASAKDGPMYKFSRNLFSAAPQGLTPEDIQARAADAQSADLQYLPEKGGSLWAFSGLIREVTDAFFLTDVSGKKLDEPWPIPKTTENFAGQARNVMEGAVYLLKTTDGKFVLLRVLEKTPSALVLQFVFQSDGGTLFDIPAKPRVSYQRPVEAETRPLPPVGAGGVVGGTPPATSPAATRTVVEAPPPATQRAGPTLAGGASPPSHLALGPNDVNEPGVIRLLSSGSTGSEPSLDTFTRQRSQMLQRRLDIISAPTHSDTEIDKKAQAVADLTALHADEPVVADLLVRQISFFNPRSTKKEFSFSALHPCFAALQQMGKPATAAALKGLATLDLAAPGDGTDSAVYKAKLLAAVIRSIEGDDTADFLFHRQAAQAADPKEKAVWDLILTK